MECASLARMLGHELGTTALVVSCQFQVGPTAKVRPIKAHNAFVSCLFLAHPPLKLSRNVGGGYFSNMLNYKIMMMVLVILAVSNF